MAAAKLHPKLAKFKTFVDSKKELKGIIVDPSFEIDYINSGSTVINMLIGGSRLPDGKFVCPGWPRGAICEIIGRESSGKSTLALTAMAHAVQTNGGTGTGLYVDLECAVKDNYAVRLGADFRPPELGGTGQLLRISPHTFEETEIVVNNAALNGVDLIVVDSVAGLISKREASRDVNEDSKGMAEVPRLMSTWMPKLQQIIARTKTCVIFTNQLRDKIGAKGYSEESLKTTTGGNSLKFWASVRIWLKPKMSVKAKRFNPLTKENEDIQIANDVEIKMFKNKIDAKQGHSGLVTIRYGVGIDELRTMMNVAEAYNIINVEGKKGKDGKKSEKMSHYRFKSPTTNTIVESTGIEKFRLSLMNSPDSLKELFGLAQERIIQGYRQIDDEELARLAEGAEFKSEEDDEGEEFDASPPDTVEADEEEVSSLSIDV